MNKLVFLFVLLIMCLPSCSTSEYEPEPPMTAEYPTIFSIENSDGTVYTLHDNCIRLRKADGSVLKELAFETPGEINVTRPYGESYKVQPTPKSLLLFGDNLFIFFNVPVNSSDWDKVESNVVYAVDKGFTNVKPKNIAFGYQIPLSDSEFAVLSSQKSLYIYNTSFEQIKHFEPANGLVADVPYFALGAYADKYYLFSYRYNSDSSKNEAQLMNYNDCSIIPVYLPSHTTVVTDFFSDDSEHHPRFNSNRVEFDYDHFNLIFEVTTYSGDKKEATYSFNLLGEQISPAREPDRVYISGTHLTGFEPVNPGEDDKKYILYYPYGGTMEIMASLWKYNREFVVDCSVESTNPSVIALEELEPSQNGCSKYKVQTLSVGNAELIFSVPDYGVVERWYINVQNLR